MKLNIVATYPAGQFGSTETHHYHFSLEVDDDADDMEVLETIFRMMNAVDGSDIEYLLNDFQCRSLSVGDYVTIDGRKYLCDFVGWKAVSVHL